MIEVGTYAIFTQVQTIDKRKNLITIGIIK
jgi:hypothetical protein